MKVVELSIKNKIENVPLFKVVELTPETRQEYKDIPYIYTNDKTLSFYGPIYIEGNKYLDWRIQGVDGSNYISKSIDIEPTISTSLIQINKSNYIGPRHFSNL